MKFNRPFIDLYICISNVNDEVVEEDLRACSAPLTKVHGVFFLSRFDLHLHALFVSDTSQVKRRRKILPISNGP